VNGQFKLISPFFFFIDIEASKRGKFALMVKQNFWWGILFDIGVRGGKQKHIGSRFGFLNTWESENRSKESRRKK
jgi:hypothetical protein